MKHFKTNYFLLLFACFISSTFLAQPQKYIRNFDDDVYGIYPCKDSTYYTISIHPGCGINSFGVRYMNRKGEVIWLRESPLSATHFLSFEGVVEDDNSFTILYYSGASNYITQLNSNGDLQFSSIVSSSGYKFTKIVSINNEFYVTGNKETPTASDSTKALLVKLNNNGVYQWAKTYRFPGYKHFAFNDAKVHNNSILVGGYFSKGGSPQPSYPYIAKLDVNGNLSQQFTYVIDSSMFLFEPYLLTNIDFYDPNIIYGKFRASSGVDCIMKIDNQFNTVWTQNIIGDLQFICATYDGGVLYTKAGYLAGNLNKLNGNGVVTNHYAHGLVGSMYQGGVSVIKRHDCGFLIGTAVGWPSDLYAHLPSNGGYCGGAETSLDNVYQEPVIRRTVNALPPASISFNFSSNNSPFTVLAPSNNLLCSGTFQCEDPLESTDIQPIEFTLFPNPASDVVRLDLPNETTIEVIDHMGKIVLMTSDFNGEINVNALAKGLYTLRAGKALSRMVKD